MGPRRLLICSTGLTLDASGNIYVVDQENNLIRKVAPDGLAAPPTAGSAGERGCDNGPALEATFNSPDGIAVDSTGFVYVSDAQNNVSRTIANDGRVSTFAGIAP